MNGYGFHDAVIIEQGSQKYYVLFDIIQWYIIGVIKKTLVLNNYICLKMITR
jgi:hypothetical protein